MPTCNHDQPVSSEHEGFVTAMVVSAIAMILAMLAVGFAIWLTLHVVGTR